VADCFALQVDFAHLETAPLRRHAWASHGQLVLACWAAHSMRCAGGPLAGFSVKLGRALTAVSREPGDGTACSAKPRGVNVRKRARPESPRPFKLRRPWPERRGGSTGGGLTLQAESAAASAAPSSTSGRLQCACAAPLSLLRSILVGSAQLQPAASPPPDGHVACRFPKPPSRLHPPRPFRPAAAGLCSCRIACEQLGHWPAAGPVLLPAGRGRTPAGSSVGCAPQALICWMSARKEPRLNLGQ